MSRPRAKGPTTFRSADGRKHVTTASRVTARCPECRSRLRWQGDVLLCGRKGCADAKAPRAVRQLLAVTGPGCRTVRVIDAEPRKYRSGMEGIYELVDSAEQRAIAVMLERVNAERPTVEIDPEVLRMMGMGS